MIDNNQRAVGKRSMNDAKVLDSRLYSFWTVMLNITSIRVGRNEFIWRSDGNGKAHGRNTRNRGFYGRIDAIGRKWRERTVVLIATNRLGYINAALSVRLMAATSFWSRSLEPARLLFRLLNAAVTRLHLIYYNLSYSCTRPRTLY